jgi:hypothetical protein
MFPKPILNSLHPALSGAAFGAVFFAVLGHLKFSDAEQAYDLSFNREEFRQYYLFPAFVGGLAGSALGGIVRATFRFPVTESHQSPLNLTRGLWGAVLFAAVGASAPKCLALLLTLYQWLFSGSAEMVNMEFRSELEYFIGYPTVGCAAVLGCAGLVTFGLTGTQTFVRSLGVIFLASSAFWMIHRGNATHPNRHERSARLCAASRQLTFSDWPADHGGVAYLREPDLQFAEGDARNHGILTAVAFGLPLNGPSITK